MGPFSALGSDPLLWRTHCSGKKCSSRPVFFFYLDSKFYIQIGIVNHPLAKRFPRAITAIIAGASPTAQLISDLEKLGFYPVHVYGLTYVFTRHSQLLGVFNGGVTEKLVLMRTIFCKPYLDQLFIYRLVALALAITNKHLGQSCLWKNALAFWRVKDKLLQQQNRYASFMPPKLTLEDPYETFPEMGKLSARSS